LADIEVRVMDLLPRTHHEFGRKDYWEKFFSKRGLKAFEWLVLFYSHMGDIRHWVKTISFLHMVFN